MSVFFNFFTFLSFFVLSLDSFFYSGFSEKYLLINSSVAFIAYVIFLLIFAIKKTPPISSLFLKINKNIIFPVLVVVSIIFLVLENTQYPNFVFSNFHINPLLFLYLPALSGIILYVCQRNYAKYSLYYIIPPLSLIVFYFINTYFERTFIFIVQEDGIAEYLQFVLYLMAAIYAFKIFRLLKKSKNNKFIYIMFLLFSIGSFFVAGEEISWGQRLLGIETPESYKVINHQNEITIHNLEIFQHQYLHLAFMLVGLYGSFSRLILKKFFPKYVNKLIIFTPPAFLFFCFFSTFAYYFLYDYYFVPYEVRFGNVPIVRWQEVFETYLSLGFFGYTFNAYKNLKNGV